MISKKLLSKIVGVPSDSIRHIEQRDNHIFFSDWINMQDALCGDAINIHELAHKCKEWAFKQDMFILSSAFIPSGGEFTSSYCITERQFSYPTIKETFYADTEPEAIFKACQWILDNKED